jgi:hypothetical protein
LPNRQQSKVVAQENQAIEKMKCTLLPDGHFHGRLQLVKVAAG